MASSITQSGGYDYEFVDTNLPDEFQCLICKLVPRDVRQASCCGKMFCKSCLDEWKTKSTNYTCPNCREDLTNNCFKDSNMNRKIRNLHIYCTNKKCRWEGSLQDIDNHLSQIVECSNGCGQQLMQCNLNIHLTTQCPKRMFSCSYCQHRDEHQHIISIHLKQCPNISVYCPNNGCNKKIKRHLMTQHRDECPQEMVMCSNGCGFKCKRYQLPTHLLDCPMRIVSCPHCQHKDEHRSITGVHLTQCPDYPIPCLNNGCEENIKRRLMTQHRDECPHEMVMCSNGCGIVFKRHELEVHLHKTCPKRIVSCVYCHKEDEYQIINGDHYDICPDYPLPCSNNGCEKKIKRCLVTQHRTACLHEMMTCSNGCGFELKRHELEVHLHKTCPKRIVSCPHCQHRGEHRSITGNHLTQCPDYPIFCPNNGCEKKIKRCLVTQHRAVCLHEMMMCSNGCGFELKRYQLPTHRTACLHEMVTCSNGCGFELKRHKLEIHLHNTCPKRIVSCPHCQRRGEHRSITGNHLTKCPDYPLPCPNNGCEKKIKRCLVTQHRTVCPHEMMTCSSGCGFKLKRHELEVHLHKTCPKRIVSCPHCQHRGEHRSITGNHLTQCPDYPIFCPNNRCEKKIKRRLMTQHRDECLHEMVMCSNGCGFKLKRYQLPTHSTVCLHEMVMCSNGCGFELKRHKLEIHLHNTCPKRIVSCPHCQRGGEHRSITGFLHLTQCPGYPIPCPNDGCEKKIKRCLMTQHRTICLHEMVICSNGCGFGLKRHKLPTHLLDCPMRIVSCPHCQHKGEHRSITGVHLTQCPDYPIPCPNNGCEKKIKRCLVTQHRAVCLHEMTTCSNGCGFKLKRHELYDHLQKTCPKRIRRCYHCHQIDEYQIICSEDHYTKCPGYPISCPNDGCEKNIKRHQLPTHRTACPHEMVMCSNGCGFELKRHKLEIHLHNTCPKRIVSCPHCQRRGEHRSITGFLHLTQCPGYPIPCPNDGCEKNIKRCLVTQHRDVCPHEMVMCSNGCGFELKRHKLEIHLHNTCPKRIVSCPHCQRRGEHRSITGFHLTQCPDYPIPCPNNGCERKIKRWLMTLHRYTCPKEEVDCQYSYMLYKCKQKMNREDIHSHMIEHDKNKITLSCGITLAFTLWVAVILLNLQIHTILLMICFNLVAILLYIYYYY